MGNKEEKAKEYAEENYDSCFCKEIAKMAYESGWSKALKNQWISTKERMPEPNTEVIFLTDIGIVMNGHYDSNVWMKMDGFWGSAYSSIDKCWDVIAWMPIPSFDEILEANKDVLKRLKDK
mgnify:CR=1 FL=1|jgi:hypothetical protein